MARIVLPRFLTLLPLLVGLAALALGPGASGDGAQPGVAPRGPKAGVVPRGAQASERGIAWLVAHQRRDGAWGCVRPATPPSAGITGLAVLALLSSGSTPDAGPHAEPIARALRWLLANQGAHSGSFASPYTTEMGHMFDQASATLAVCMAEGMGSPTAVEHAFCEADEDPDGETPGVRARRARAGEALRRAMRFLADSVLADGGFARAGRAQDAQVTAQVWVALRALHSVGIPVALDLDRAAACTPFPAGGARKVRYAGSARAGHAAGWLRIQLGLGRFADPAVAALAEDMAARYLSTDVPDQVSEWDYVAAFHLAQAFYREQEDGRPKWWDRWYPPAVDYLVKIQNPDGSWSIVDCLHCDAFATALAVLVLETERGLLPALGL
jgi:hypothetical protein